MKIVCLPDPIGGDGGNDTLGSDPIQSQFEPFLSTRPTGLMGGEGFIWRGLVVSCRKRCRFRNGINGLGCRVYDGWGWESLFKHGTGTVDPHTLMLIKCNEGVEEMNS